MKCFDNTSVNWILIINHFIVLSLCLFMLYLQNTHKIKTKAALLPTVIFKCCFHLFLFFYYPALDIVFAKFFMKKMTLQVHWSLRLNLFLSFTCYLIVLWGTCQRWGARNHKSFRHTEDSECRKQTWILTGSRSAKLRILSVIIYTHMLRVSACVI